MVTRSTLCALACALVTSFTFDAAAQMDKAAAEALFEEAMRVSKAGDYASACPKFEESQRLEPSLGAQYYLADCYEKIGRTASAWANFVGVADKARLAGEVAKEKAARERAKALEPKLSRLSIEVEDASIPGLSVLRGDAPVGSGQWGVPVPVDPGSVAVRASAPGRKDWSQTIDVPAGGSLTAKVPRLEPLPAAAPPLEKAPPPPAAPVARPPEPPQSNTRRTVGIVLGATGVVALGAGGVLAILAKNADSDSKRAGECTADGACTSAGLDDRNRALHLADAATVVTIVGGALAITGGVIWLTAPKGHSESSPGPSAELGVGPRSLLLRGRF
jgi:hypothetical protein